MIAIMNLVEKQQQLIDDYGLIENPQERLSAVVDQARRFAPLPENQRIEVHRVRGCISQVWLVSELRAGRCHFRVDADGPLVRGLVTLVCEFFNDATPAEILACDTDPIAALDLLRNLSPTRQNGLAAIRAAIRAFAAAA